MCADTKKSSPYSFYAFYQLFCKLQSGTSTPQLSFQEICTKLYPNERVDTFSETSLFITWEKKSERRDGYVLRGCIGTFAKLPLLKGIERYSLIAALQDRRFAPIGEEELPKLRCSCNILQNFETIYGSAQKGDIFNWELGLHGIELQFKDPQNGSLCSATFLPDVMIEQHWDKEETFICLIEKGGVTCGAKKVLKNYQDYFVEVIRYEGNKSTITYEEFEEGLGKIH